MSKTRASETVFPHPRSIVLGYDVDGRPIVPVKVRRIRNEVNLLKIICPYCGRRHVHGGGAPEDDPRKHLGHRGAHCLKLATNNRGYILAMVEPGGRTTPPVPSQRAQAGSEVGRVADGQGAIGPGAEGGLERDGSGGGASEIGR